MAVSHDPFANVAPYYSGRVSYAPELFQLIAEKMQLGPRARVLDLCCGQGELAAGLSPYAGEVVAVDRSEEMLKAAREGAPENITYLQADVASEAHQDFGRFDLVTIGRALEYLPRVNALKLLERSLETGGTVFIGRAEIRTETAWRRYYWRVKMKYGFRPRTIGQREAEYFRDTSFEQIAMIIIKTEVLYDIDALVKDSLSYPSLVEDATRDISAFRRDLEGALDGYKNADGLLPAVIGSGGLVLRRK